MKWFHVVLMFDGSSLGSFAASRYGQLDESAKCGRHWTAGSPEPVAP